MTVTKNDLTATDLLVMEALCRSMVTPSAITLAADLWDPETPTLGADPVGFVQWVLDSLAEKGLVKFRLKEIRHSPGNLEGELQGRDPYESFAFQIRLTRDGWELMGYPHIHAQVFTRLSTSQNLPHTGDRTNFRRHSSQAEGGPITTETFAEHRVNFPHHRHPLMDPFGDDEMSETTRRAYVRITPELEESIVRYRDQHPGANVAEMSEELAYSERTIKYVLYDLPRIRRDASQETNGTSQKQRILLALRAMDYNNITDLRKTLGRADTAHDIVHALHDLHTEGKVDFVEQGARKQPIRIHLTERGRSYIANSDDNELLPKSNGTMATVESIPEGATLHSHVVIEKSEYEQGLDEAAEAMTVALELNDFPLLDQLLDREIDRKNSDQKGLQYIAAAELIRANDPETAALLDAKAAESDLPYPSPLETEYIKYAETHPRIAYFDADGRAQR